MSPAPAERRRRGRGVTALLLLGTTGALAGIGCGTGPTPETDRRLGVVLVVLDAARRDHFGAYGYERDTTPRFDALAKESVIFERAYAESSYTVPSISSLLTGPITN